MNRKPTLDPEAVVLSKVYALLIRAARKKKAEEQQADGQAKTRYEGPLTNEGPYSVTSPSAE